MFNTKVVRVDPSLPELKVSGSGVSLLEDTVDLLEKGEVAGIPTETVYGLAANALSSSACRKIFEAKKRPLDNPLIVHVSSIEMLRTIIDGEIQEKAQKLIDKFWPGPMTLLFQKSSLVPDEVSCGQPTVAVRMPSHPVALKIIEMCGFPLAAPSANSSGRPSPTMAEHVLTDLSGIIPCVVDGGQCGSGVESTVIDVIRNPPAILRPGGITFEMLLPLLPDLQVYKKDFVDKSLEAAPTTPGMKYKHYSPNASVILFEGSSEAQHQQILEKITEFQGSGSTFGILTTSSNRYESNNVVFLGNSPNEVARSLFYGLRELDKRKVDYILVEGIDEVEEGLAVMNRLRKAASQILK